MFGQGAQFVDYRHLKGTISLNIFCKQVVRDISKVLNYSTHVQMHFDAIVLQMHHHSDAFNCSIEVIQTLRKWSFVQFGLQNSATFQFYVRQIPSLSVF